jgi:hypothetical protein
VQEEEKDSHSRVACIETIFGFYDVNQAELVTCEEVVACPIRPETKVRSRLSILL